MSVRSSAAPRRTTAPPFVWLSRERSSLGLCCLQYVESPAIMYVKDEFYERLGFFLASHREPLDAPVFLHHPSWYIALMYSREIANCMGELTLTRCGRAVLLA